MQEIFRGWRQFTGDGIQATLGGHRLKLEVLSSPGEQQKGFMGREEPEDDFGLLFVYREPRVLGFWMKNVPFDLDLIGVNGEGEVTEVILLKANDESTKILRHVCTKVIELKAGWCERHGVHPGDFLSL